MNHHHNNRARYPPGMGLGRGGFHPNVGHNPNLNQNPGLNQNQAFQPRPPYQQQPHYVQRHLMQQPQQQQQWLRRDANAVDEVEKTVQSEAVDSRFVCCHFVILPQFLLCVVIRVRVEVLSLLFFVDSLWLVVVFLQCACLMMFVFQWWHELLP